MTFTGVKVVLSCSLLGQSTLFSAGYESANARSNHLDDRPIVKYVVSGRNAQLWPPFSDARGEVSRFLLVWSLDALNRYRIIFYFPGRKRTKIAVHILGL